MCGSSHTELEDPLSSSLLFRIFSLPVTCSLAHKKLFLGLLARKLDFSEFQLLMLSTVVQLQGLGHLGEKP